MSKEKSAKISFISTMPKNVDLFPEPVPAFKEIPTWFKKVLPFYDNDDTPMDGIQRLTVKRCVAFLDMLSSGYIIKAPFDIYIDTTNGQKIFQIPKALEGFSSLGIKPMISAHDMKQVEGYPIDRDQYIEHIFRINPIWVAKGSKGVSALFIQPQHHEVSPLYAIAAVIDIDGYPSDGLLSFLVKKEFRGYIHKGTPLVQVIPFMRQDFVSEIIRDQKENDKVKQISNRVRTVFNSGYRKMMWKKKSYT
jgi:hypothetical protein